MVAFARVSKTRTGLCLGLLLICAAHAQAAEAENGTLTQIIPGHYLYNSGFQNAGVIVTSEGAIVVDGLNSEARGRHVRQKISEDLNVPVRYLVTSTFHNNFTRGNAAYADVVKIGHELHREDLLALMREEGVGAAEQEARLPNLTYQDQLTLHLGGKEIQVIHVGPAHTRGDSVVFVPEDRIVYVSELMFYDRFPWMNTGYVSWIEAIDTVLALDADIFVPGQGHEEMFSSGFPGDSREAFLHTREVLVAARDAVQAEIDRGASEEEALSRVQLAQYRDLGGYEQQLETVIQRTYQDLQGTLE
jgi:glyoxylase-like metal-dependent hydrolase (beta-lactamase superfamily II)